MIISRVLSSLEYIPIFVASAILLLALNTYLAYRRLLHAFQHHPGERRLFSVHGLVSTLLPPIPLVTMGANWGMLFKYDFYAKHGWDVITHIGFFPSVSSAILVADPLAVKEITYNRSRFPKAIEDYDVLSIYGKNVLVTEGEEWKQHRKIVGPVFSERNNKLVWDEAIRIMLDMFDNWGTDNTEVIVDHASNILIPIALLIISVAGFGRRIPWKEDNYVPAGHKLTFKDAVHIVSSNVDTKVLAPNWAYPFSKHLRHVQLAFDELEIYMKEMIEERRSSAVKEERYDLFSALLDASDGEKEGITLPVEELIGNIFIFLIAGHETTAHTVCFAMGLLALDQDEQEKLYQHIMSVMPDSRIPNYGLMNALTHSLATLYETLRLYPPVPTIPKKVTEDTTIPVVRPDGTKGRITVPKDTRIILNPTGLHFNTRYWSDPEMFNPSRFLGDWPKDAFLPFSGGARACVGRRFAETEGVAILTALVSRYKIELKNPELYEGLTHMQKREKLLANRLGLTVTPLSVPLVFRKR